MALLSALYSRLMDIVVEGASQQAVVRDLQRNPASGRVAHIDFQRVSANRELTVSVPLHYINEEDCVGVKMGGASIIHNLTEVEISCLPADLPEYIEVDMADVDVGFSVHLSGLALPAGVTIVALTYGEDRDIPVVSVAVRRGGAEEEEEAAELEAEVEEAAGDEAAADSGEADEE